MGFSYQNEELVISSPGTPSKSYKMAELIKDREEPLYVYDIEGIRNRYTKFVESLAGCKQPKKFHYAMKANSHPEVLKALKGQGASVDVVSLGEIRLALSCGFEPADVVFSGVGKSHKEITEALKLGVFQINVESLPELERIGRIAKKLGVVAPVAVRFNPDVNPETHPYITTGFRENKFGLSFSEIEAVESVVKQFKDSLKLQGLSIHIGSQIRDNSSFVEAIEKVVLQYKRLKARESWSLETLDIGGGLGINYDKFDEATDLSLIESYGQEVAKGLEGVEATILFEPGRVLVGRFGALLTKVEYIKINEFKNFLIVNTGMHHLMRPCLYKAFHNIVPVFKAQNESKKVLYDIVGPICESSDVLGSERLLPEQKEGDWLAIMDVGAYGAVMASRYNQHEPVEEVAI